MQTIKSVVTFLAISVSMLMVQQSYAETAAITVNSLTNNRAAQTRVTLKPSTTTTADNAKLATFVSTQRQQALRNKAQLNTTAAYQKKPASNQQATPSLASFQARHLQADTPAQIVATDGILMKRPLNSYTHKNTAKQFLNSAQAYLGLDNPEQELKLVSSLNDSLEKQHLRFHQYFHEIPVWNSALTVHLNKTGDVELLDGTFFRTPKKISLTAVFTEQQALASARQIVPQGAEANIATPTRLVIYPQHNQPASLAWEINLRGALDQNWLVLIDAHTGEQLLAYNQVADAATTGNARDLFGETRNLNIYSDNGQFYMADTSKAMFNRRRNPLNIDYDTGSIYILDAENQAEISADGEVDLPNQLALTQSRNKNSGWPADAVSATYTLSETYDYYQERHNRNSIDGNGSSIIAVVRVGVDYFNAFWNGQLIAFGDAQPFAGALDVVGHELTHGVIENTANLIYLNQSGALNEALSDIFGEAIEARTFGQTDWVIGGQLDRPLRSLIDPGSINFARNSPYPSKMSEFEQLPPTLDGDFGGVHINSGIINRAFYLLAEGLDDAIGIEDAEQIFYRAIAFHLVPRSKFIDARLAVIESATELYGAGSNQVLKAAEAFDAVEIFDASSSIPEDPSTSGPLAGTVTGDDATVYVAFNQRVGSRFLYRRDPEQRDSINGTQLSFFRVAGQRPSVDRNSGLIAFINGDSGFCTIDSARTAVESCQRLDADIHSVAMSPDGSRYAVVYKDGIGGGENKITIINAIDGSSRSYQVSAPATEGASTATIVNVDAMDFSNDGEFLVYDALNEISTLDGSKIGVWSIYSLDLTHETNITLIAPKIGFDFAFPALSQTSNNFLTFDIRDRKNQTIDVTTANLITGATQTIFSSSEFGTPSFNGDDSAVIFSKLDTSTPTSYSLYEQPLAADRISPAGSSSLWLKNADYGVIYRRGETISPVNTNIQPEEGLWWIANKSGSGFDIELTANNDLFMVWYTYNVEGDPLWYLASNVYNGGNWNADVLEYTWDGSQAIANRVGDVNINFQDSTHAKLEWSLNIGGGFEQIEFFQFGAAGENKAGTWFEPAQSGYGLTQVQQAFTQIKVLYFYDEAGNPKWALGASDAANSTIDMEMFTGSCPTCPYQPSQAFFAGTVSTSFESDNSGTLSTDISLPSPYSGQWLINDAIINNLSE